MEKETIFFWATDNGGRIDAGCMSQWANHGFVIDRIYYRSAEQFMMAEKARLFNDTKSLEKIMGEKSSMIIKRLGRAVKNRNGEKWTSIDMKKWDDVRFDVVVRGNFAKFSQNDELKEYLLSTGDALLVEASPKDKIWGIGLDAAMAARMPEKDWPGQNLLGKALMRVRERLAAGEGNTPDVQENMRMLKERVAEEESKRRVNADFSKAKARRSRRPKGVAVEAEKELPPDEEAAIAAREAGEKFSSNVFVKTRLTLLRNVGSGDKDAFQKFYNIYSPAMLKYLGLTDDSQTEKDQWDIVQTVFANFYKRFVKREDPATGDMVLPGNILSLLTAKKIKFRQYLKECLKNAVRTKWRNETKRGKVRLVSIDSEVEPGEGKTWKERLENQGVDPKFLDCADAEGERLSAVLGIWKTVVKGIVLDESLSDCTRDVIGKSLLDNVPAADLAKKWGIEENNVYAIKHRGKTAAESATRAIYEMMSDSDVDIKKEVARLYKIVAAMKPSRHMDKFMIKLARKLLGKE